MSELDVPMTGTGLPQAAIRLELLTPGPIFEVDARPGRRRVEHMGADNILLVDDDLGSIQLMGRILSNVGSLRFATNGEDALRLAREFMPDLILLDSEMPGMSGFETCEVLKADPALAHVPVIFVTSHSEAAFEVSGFELGAADFIAKPISAPLVLARVRNQLRIKSMSDELRRIATIDSLTGVANRRRFEESLEREWRRGRRSGDPIALLMIDVDHFKLFNDHYGHPAGDTCLQDVARALSSASLRPADLVARHGGEEFVVLLPQTTGGGAEHVAQAVLDAVQRLDIAHVTSPTAPHVTVSVGIACYNTDSGSWVPPSADSRCADDQFVGRCPTDLVQAADRAMYAAKHAGRAQARLLDIADVDNPNRIREIRPPSRRPHPPEQEQTSTFPRC